MEETVLQEIALTITTRRIMIPSGVYFLEHVSGVQVHTQKLSGWIWCIGIGFFAFIIGVTTAKDTTFVVGLPFLLIAAGLGYLAARLPKGRYRTIATVGVMGVGLRETTDQREAHRIADAVNLAMMKARGL